MTFWDKEFMNNFEFVYIKAEDRQYKGIVLPIVLVIFALLAMLVIGFGFATRAEFSGISAQENLIQARRCAISGLESVAMLVMTKSNDFKFWYDNPDVFRDKIVFSQSFNDKEHSSWRYSIVSTNFDSQEIPRFGLTDEASKVNINVASRDQLLRLPKMTPALVDALLDWRQRGENGHSDVATDNYYMGLAQPYRCKHAPLDSIDELLLIKGFASDIVFGEDMNRNGLLDANEDDGRKSLPVDNGDGVLDRGLYPYITVFSREPEVTDSDPYQPRVNIKQWPTVMLKSMLEKHFSENVVNFILTARMAGIDFGTTPANLIGLSFEYNNRTYNSPLTVSDLPVITDVLTTGYHLNSDGFVYGRININTAPRTVLKTIGLLTDKEIEGIISLRNRLDKETTKTIAWLVTQNVMDIDKFKKVAPILTARSYQFSVETIGYCDNIDIQVRLQAVIELRLPKIQYLYYRDMSRLGRAYNTKSFGEIIIVNR